MKTFLNQVVKFKLEKGTVQGQILDRSQEIGSLTATRLYRLRSGVF